MRLLVDYAMSFVGQPYLWGKESPLEGFDCSGLVQEILRSAGADIPGDQTAQELYNHFEQHGTIGSYQPGALAFFGESSRKISHVGFCVDAYRMIEAAGGRSTTKTLEDAVRAKAYVRMRLIKSRSDLVAIIRPKYIHIGVI